MQRYLLCFRVIGHARKYRRISCSSVVGWCEQLMIGLRDGCKSGFMLKRSLALTAIRWAASALLILVVPINQNGRGGIPRFWSLFIERSLSTCRMSCKDDRAVKKQGVLIRVQTLVIGLYKMFQTGNVAEVQGNEDDVRNERDVECWRVMNLAAWWSRWLACSSSGLRTQFPLELDWPQDWWNNDGE